MSSRIHPAASLVLIVAGLIGAATPTSEELVSLDTRPGVTVPFFLVRPTGPPSASVVLFAGGHGHLALSASGIGWGQNNFLVRTRRRFADHGLLVAVVDSPSDRGSQGLWRFRSTADHAEDVRVVIAAVRRMANVPVWVVGTSMGTVSAANAAARLRDGGPDGLVLTASVTRPSREQIESLDDVRVRDIRVPTLVVHHRDDGCQATPYQGAVTLVGSLKQVPRRELITMEGGQPPRSKPCEALSAHGFLGLEENVVAAWPPGSPHPGRSPGRGGPCYSRATPDSGGPFNDSLRSTLGRRRCRARRPDRPGSRRRPHRDPLLARHGGAARRDRERAGEAVQPEPV